MFVFLTAVRHHENANDYAQVERLLSLTLRSICGQTDEEFRVVVVCNSTPQVQFQDYRIHYHVVDFPPASSKKSSDIAAAPKFRDKGTKYLSGLLFARQFDPSYVYIIDSDDWVNRTLVATLKNSERYPVWYVNQGYTVNYREKSYKRLNGLCRYCGSTFVYDFDFLLSTGEVRGDINEFSSQDELIAATSEFFVLRLLSNHTINYKYFQSLGWRPKAIPLWTACWIQGTGENVSGVTGGAEGLPIDYAFQKDFSLPSSELSEKTPSTFLRLRDLLANLKSAYLWWLSRATGKNRF